MQGWRFDDPGLFLLPSKAKEWNYLIKYSAIFLFSVSNAYHLRTGYKRHFDNCFKRGNFGFQNPVGANCVRPRAFAERPYGLQY